jgi:Leucine Rich repeat
MSRINPFRLRHVIAGSLLLIGAVLALSLVAWFIRGTVNAKRQHAAVRAIARAHGLIAYRWEWQAGHYVRNAKPWAPRWLIRALGRDFFGDVVFVELIDRGSDEILAEVENLPGLEELILTGSPVGDAGLRGLRNLTHLRVLELRGTKVTDVGMGSLQDLLFLQVLDLSETGVTDEGLARLRRLKRLEVLYLDGDGISDQGLDDLAGLTALRRLGLAETEVTDGGLEQLKGLTQLESIDLQSTHVTEFGAQDLRRAHRGIKVLFTPTPLF